MPKAILPLCNACQRKFTVSYHSIFLHFIWLEIKVRHEVLNDLLNADQLLSVLVKNGISINELGRNHNDVHNVHCIEEDDYEKVMKSA